MDSWIALLFLEQTGQADANSIELEEVYAEAQIHRSYHSGSDCRHAATHACHV